MSSQVQTPRGPRATSGRCRDLFACLLGGGTTVLATLVWGVPGGVCAVVLHMGVLAWGRRTQDQSEVPDATQALGERVQEQDQEKQETQATSLAKSAFLARMSHSIRTPLLGIAGMADLLAASELDQEQRDHAEQIRGTSAQLIRTLGDVLDFAKVEVGKVDLEQRGFDLERCVHDVIEQLYSRATEKRLSLTYRLDANAPPTIEGDASRIAQVLMNLVSNAIEFTEKGGVHVAVDANSSMVDRTVLRFTVEDTGPGVPEGRREAIFRPFTRFAAETDAEENLTASGLGLSICRQLVELMGGKLELRSTTNRGSTFQFTVPVPKVATEAQEPASGHTGQRILVIDRCSATRRLLRELTSQWGMEATEATAGEEALQALSKAVAGGCAFDFALVDQDVPPFGGKELATRIKGAQELKHTRLVLVRNPGRLDRAGSLVRSGIDAWITKPVGARSLRHALHHLDGHLPDGRVGEDEQGAAEDRGWNARVLLVEDNVVNQKVSALLIKQLGCQVDTATTGHDAIQLVSEQKYDVVFMDCLMPVIDGFETTNRIRALDVDWASTLPIVGLTREAASSERLMCMEVGMVDSLAKPIRREGLERMLRKWAGQDTTTDSDVEPMNDSNDQVLDADVIAALRELGGEDDPELFAELVGLFLDDTPKRLAELCQALEQGDPTAVEQAAHALKSSAANLGAFALSDLLRQIEFAGKEKDLSKAAPLVALTGEAYQRVENALNSEIG